MKKSGILILVLALSLQGCFFAAGAAAGAAAIAVVYDHRNIHKILQDADIAKRIAAEINKIPGIHNEAHIEVSVFNRVVLQIPSGSKGHMKLQILFQMLPVFTIRLAFRHPLLH
jgi:osmotically-inducible protein OsmY